MRDRVIIFAERIEGCVAADNTGGGSLTPNELRDIFIVNRFAFVCICTNEKLLLSG